MREIGGEFWDVPTGSKENGVFPETTQWYLSGRSALKAIVSELKNCRTVALPSWCCESMIIPFTDAGLQVCFYPVYWDKELIQNITLDCDVLFLMDYFGYTGDRPDLSEYHGVVIRDVTHSVFSTTYDDADYTFGSLRKWCGVFTGGFAWKKDGRRLPAADSDESEYIALREQAMNLKRAYINRPEEHDKSFLGIFRKAEECLESAGIPAASERDVIMAKTLDVPWMKSVRRRNAAILRNAFPEWLLFPKMEENDCPMFVPVLVPDGKRDSLRRYLIENEIYCPVHWPENEFIRLDERTSRIYRDELSLVCDQRYSEEDMAHIIKTIESFRKEA